MAINFPDSPSNGDTYTAAGKTFIYNSTKGSWAASGAYTNSDVDTHLNTSGAATDEFLQWSGSDYQWSASGVKTYATVDDLPLSGQSNGAQAFVTGTNRLYIWSASTANSSYEGWFNIALVNTNPSLSGASSDYALAIDGVTPTVVTLASTDPEGVPVTYSIASDTSGDIATVVQGTGANTNVFTITPTSNTSVSGAFSLTFKASDGINIVQTSSNFTLQFTTLNSKYTTALITSVGANLADNNDFVDSSTSNHTITTIGNVTQNTFSPYRHGGYSTYFDGTGDYVETPTDAGFTIGTNQFTVECWFQVQQDTQQTIFSLMNGGSNIINVFYWHTDNNIGVVTPTLSQYGNANSNTVDIDTWHHLALVRNATTMYLYIDGSLMWSSANTENLNNNRVRIAANQYGNNLLGYVSDFRFINGTAITPASGGPNDRLTAVTNTKLLTCHLPYISDGSTTGHTITVVGNTKTEPFAPYDYSPYASGNNGGSMYFDGTGDRITFSHASDFSFGTGDFTIEFWIKTPTNAITGGYSRTICEIGQLHVYMRITSYHGGVDSAIRVYDETTDNDVGNLAIANDLWHHIAVVRESGTMKCWVDGVYNTGVSNSKNLSETSTNAIGGRTDGNGHMEGTLADFRVVKGTAVYTGTDDFVPPAEPLTPITNTSLLLSGTNAGIIDKSQSVKTITLNGDVKSSTTQTKYLSSSMYFDGTDDNLKCEFADLNTNDFTIEFWFWASNINSTFQALFDARSDTNTGNPLVWIKNTNVIYFYTTAERILGTTTITASTWHHVALVRNSGVFTLYLNGSSEGTYTGADSFPADTLTLGQRYNGTAYNFQGYMSDFRITKGLARYTANFTPPTAALQG